MLTTALALAAWSQGVQRIGPGSQGSYRVGNINSCPALAIVLPQPARIDRLTVPLGLTQDQVTKLKELAVKTEKTLAPLQKASVDTTKAFKEALTEASYDEKQVKELAAAAQKAETVLLNARIDNWTKIRAILTADQAEKLVERPRMTGPNPGGPGGPGTPPPGGAYGPAPGGPTPPNGPPPPDGEGEPPPPPPPGE
ncbi:MAG: Spy/CpxP family protein refolding chaperone [Candidatus Contubernalis sp.]|nr:Spy/CpxP family protein refolding chaperone [Candidatus Contubernalis sp.]